MNELQAWRDTSEWAWCDTVSVHSGEDEPDRFAANLSPVMDDLAFALAVVDADARLRYANLAAMQELRTDASLRVVGAYVRGLEEAAQLHLRRDIASAMSGRRAYRAYGVGEAAAHVAFVPLPSARTRQVHAVALVFERRSVCDKLAIYFFARHHGLTEREERLLTELATGISVAKAAAILGIKVSTAQTHVRHILGKTQSKNLRVLTGSLAKLPPLAARLGHTVAG